MVLKLDQANNTKVVNHSLKVVFQDSSVVNTNNSSVLREADTTRVQEVVLQEEAAAVWAEVE